MCSFINLKYVIDGGLKDFNHKLSIAALFIIVGYPLFQASLYLFVRIETIRSDSFRARVGVVYESISLQSDKSRLKWPLYETFQKFVLAGIVVFFIDFAFA